MKKLPSCLLRSALFFAILLCCGVANAQFNFHKAFSLGDEAHTPAHTFTSSGEYANAGFYFPQFINGQPVATAKVPILKLDGGFNLDWAKHYLLSNEIQNNNYNVDMRAYDIKETITNGYIVCGEIVDDNVAGAPAKHSFIMRLDGAGNVIWFNKYFPNGNLNSITEADDFQGFIATGYIEVPGGGEENRLLRIEDDGTVMWMKTITTSSGTGPFSAFREVVRHSPNQYVAVGNTATFIESDFCVQESDILLTIINENTFPTTFTNIPIGRPTDPAGFQYAEFGNTVTVNGQGNIIIGGHVMKSHVNDCNANPPQDLLLLKVHPTGLIMFSQEVNLQAKDISRDVTIDGLFSEFCVSGNSDEDAFLYTADMGGGFRKLEFFNHAGFKTTATSIVENGSPRYTFIGNSEVMGAGYDDIYLVEQDPTTVDDCHDRDETRDPVDVILDVFSGETVDLFIDEVFVDVEAFDIEVLDTLLCSSTCSDPIAVDDVFSVCEDSVVTVFVYANDSYTPPISGVIVTAPTNGTVSFNSLTGELVYTPNPGFVGTDLIEYQITDACGTAIGQVQITIDPKPVAGFTFSISGLTVSFTDVSLNGPTSWSWDFGDGTSSSLQNPTHTYASAGGYAVCLTVTNDCGEDVECRQFSLTDPCDPVDPVSDVMDVCAPAGGSINVLLNDYYTSAITVVIVSGPSNGTATLSSPGGILTYVPNSGFTGVDQLTYRLCNLCGMCGTATVTINVSEAPVANFSASISGNTVAFTDLSTGPPTSWLWDFGDGSNSSLQNPTHTYATGGTFNACLTVTNLCGSDTLCEQITICEPVDPVNDVMNVCSPGGGSFNVLTNDYYSSPITVVIVSGPSNGTATLTNPGGILTYVPNAGFLGSDQLTYRLCNLCGMCGTATVAINVTGIAPVANFSVLGSATSLTFTDLSTNSPTSWLWDFGDGSTSFSQNPTHTYGSAGAYTVCLTATNNCGSDQLCEEITVCEPIDPVNDQMDVCSPDGGSINVLTNDYYSSAITVVIVSGPSNGTATLTNPGGILTYVPNSSFTGTDQITYRLCNLCGMCGMATVTINVTGIAPVANFSVLGSGTSLSFTDLSTNSPTSWLWDFGDGSTSFSQNPTHTYGSGGAYTVCLTATNNCGSDQLCEEITVCEPIDPVNDQMNVCSPDGGSINVLTNDYYSSPITVVIVSGPSNGTATLTSPGGILTYVPNSSFTGTDQITYRLCNLCGMCGLATVTINVTGIAPVANFSGTTTGPSVAFNDLSTGNPTSWSWDFGDGNSSSVQNPTHTYAAPGTYTVCLTATNVCGSDTLCEDFTIVVCDNVDPVSDQFTVCEPAGGIINPLLNDYFTVSPPTWNITGGPSNGVILSVAPNGEIFYRPNAGFTGTDVITYELCDGCGTCYPETITITVISAPTANFSGTTTGPSVAFNDLSTGNPTSWSWDFGDGNSSSVQNPTHTYAASGTFNVCLTATNQCGSDTLCEEFGINPCVAPDPVQDEVTICTPNGGSIDILANDFYSPGDTYTFVSGPSNGSIISDDGNGIIYYVPNSGFIGTDTITYSLCNPCGNCGTALIIIHVNYPPVANFSGVTTGLTIDFTDLSTNNPTVWFWDFGDGTTSTLQNPTHTYTAPGTYNVCLSVANECGDDMLCEPYTVNEGCGNIDPVADVMDVCAPGGGSHNILANDFYTSPVTVAIVSGPSNGMASLNSAGLLTYIPDPGFVGTDMLTYRLCNLCGLCFEAVVTINVTAPPAANFSVATSGLTAAFTDLSTNNPTSWQWQFGDGTGSTSQNPTHTYTADGTYSVCLSVTNNCGSIEICEDVTVAGCPPPIAIIDLEYVCPDETITFNVLINDTYTSPHAVSIITPPTQGSIVTFDPVIGDIIYSANSSFSGADSILYLLDDACGGDTAWVHLICSDPIDGVLVTPRLFLEGPHDGAGWMSDDFFNLVMLPLAQPFSGAPWNYPGTEAAGSYADFEQSDLRVTDWVMVYLLDKSSPNIILGRQAGLLWQDGVITDVAGNPVQFSLPADDYYVAVIPRNHLGISTAFAVALNSTTSTLVDFADPLLSTWGGALDRKPSGAFMVLVSGDANCDGFINSIDLNFHWRPQNGTAPTYLNDADWNLDGAVNSVDLNIYFRPNNGLQAHLPFTWP